jgi:hypothetical protein
MENHLTLGKQGQSSKINPTEAIDETPKKEGKIKQ